MFFPDFFYESQPCRVVFGRGSLQMLGQQIERIGAQRALILCTPGMRPLAEKIMQQLGPLAVGVFDKAVMHVPVNVAREARELAQWVNADCIVTIGGESTIGLGKAVALAFGSPIIAIPTSYSGSEMTSHYSLTDLGVKRGGKDPRVLPRGVIYDPELTMFIPKSIAVVSGINAIAHAAEGLYAQDGNPVMSMFAEEGIRSMAAGLTGVALDYQDLDARSDCLYGAWLCGTVQGRVGVALHHKLCELLGTSFGVAQAELQAIILPHSIAYNESAVPGLGIRICKALCTDSDSGGGALWDFAKKMGAPLALQKLGLTEENLDAAADFALSEPFWNPRPLERAAIRSLLQSAFEGKRPVYPHYRSRPTAKKQRHEM
jgi:maleylacetate reductase